LVLGGENLETRFDTKFESLDGRGSAEELIGHFSYTMNWSFVLGVL
jgi:hypothetical protein